MYADRSSTEIPVPASIRHLVAGCVTTCVWENEVGGLTFAVDAPRGRRYLKWTPRTSGIDLQQEVDRLGWAAGRWPVPRVIDQGGDETGTWILTVALPGENAVSDRWRADPATAVRAIGAGLRALHDALPVADCPFSWSAAARVTDARRRAAAGLIDPLGWNETHQPLGVAGALALVARPPQVDRIVVCHGDACAPNTLIGDDGQWAGHVDLGSLGLADRWADIAVATWSTQWNYGPGWEPALLSAYGVDPDQMRTDYYRLLWDLGE